MIDISAWAKRVEARLERLERALAALKEQQQQQQQPEKRGPGRPRKEEKWTSSQP